MSLGRAVFLCLGLSGAAAVRELLDKTSTPCKQQYDAEFLAAQAEAHMAKYAGDVKCGLEKPRLLLLLGGSGAGKGTFLRHLKTNGMESLVPHGLDEYLDYLPEYQQSVANESFVFVDAADACYSGGAIPIAKATQKLLIERRCSLFYEETGKNLDRILKRVLPPFTDAGYILSLVIIDNLPSVAIGRAADRLQAEGRYAPADYIKGSFKGVFENYHTLRENELVTEAAYCDNSCVNVKSGDTNKAGACLQCWIHHLPENELPQLMPTSAFLTSPLTYLPRGGDEL